MFFLIISALSAFVKINMKKSIITAFFAVFAVLTANA